MLLSNHTFEYTAFPFACQISQGVFSIALFSLFPDKALSHVLFKKIKYKEW
jgi:hypothetical protein